MQYAILLAINNWESRGQSQKLAVRIADCWNNLSASLQSSFGKIKGDEVVPDKYLEHIRPLLLFVIKGLV